MTFGWRMEAASSDSRLEATPELFVVGELGRDELQSDGALEPQVGRPVDDAHSTPAGDALDAVTGELRADLEVHWGCYSGTGARSRRKRVHAPVRSMRV